MQITCYKEITPFSPLGKIQKFSILDAHADAEKVIALFDNFVHLPLFSWIIQSLRSSKQL